MNSAVRIKRIMKDLKIIKKLNLEKEGIYTYVNDEDIGKIYVMIIGTEGTPYEHGYYFFEITMPNDYPLSPPKFIFRTTDGKIRFNPNLYTNGKVCLSIINTWNGPGWVPTLTLDKVLITIQSMILNNYPLKNEPGLEDSSIEEIETYNEIIRWYNYSFSILNVTDVLDENYAYFIPIINKLFIEKYDMFMKIFNELNKYNSIYMECRFFKLSATPDYELLQKKYTEKFNKIKKK